MTAASRVAKNTFVLTALKLLLPASSMAMVLVVARYLGTEGLGRYSLIFSWFNVFATIASLGMSAVISRDAAAMPEKVPALLSSALSLGTLSSLLLIGVIYLLRNGFGYDENTQVALALLSLAILPATLLSYFEATFVALERMEFIAFFSLSENLLRVMLSVLMLLLGHGIQAVAAVAVGTQMLACGAGLLFVRKLGLLPRGSFDLSMLRHLVGAAPTFALIGVLAMVISKIDIFMLSKMGAIEDVGLYGAGSRILEIASVLPASLCLSVYPGLARASKSNPELLPRLGGETFRYLFALTLPVAVGATVLAEPIMSFLYGSSFRSAATVLAVLVWMVIPYAWIRYYAYVLVAANRQRIDLLFNVMLLMLTAILNWLLIPRYGAVGAALAMLLSMCLYALGQHIYMRLCLRDRLATLPGLLKPLWATVVLGICVWFLRELPVLLTVAIGAAVYFATLWAIGFFTVSERKLIFEKLSWAQHGLRSKI